MKYISFLIILFSINSFSEDYKSAVRLKEGDVISADVFNDILDRIELTLKAVSSEDLLGSWELTQTVCPYGSQMNCLSNFYQEGYGNPYDNLFRQRTDIISFLDDGDGTYSFQQSNYCSFLVLDGNNSAEMDSPCKKSYAVIDRKFVVNGVKTPTFIAKLYDVKRISETRLLLTSLDADMNFVRLDKINLPPNPPTALSASLSGSSVSLSWTASEGGATSYTVKAKTSATGTYSDVVTNNSGTTYTDTLSSGTKWYRVFAVDSNGTSIGSNVVSVSR